MVLNTATVSLAVTPTIVSTLLSHYIHRKPLRQRPTAHLSYDEGLHLIRSFLVYASHHTVEELQAFTGQWVPHPQWIRVEEVAIDGPTLARAAALLEDQLGPDGLQQVGGKTWWRWRPSSRVTPGQLDHLDGQLKAEWIEMKSDYHVRRSRVNTNTNANSNPDITTRVMLYVHGGAYFFGSVDEHRYQMQRHARKLQARVLAPRYRLAPQFPFPCGLHDCLATYLWLLDSGHEPSSIVLAGDSAGGGMVLALLVVLRDRGLPLPAGAVLISPWVDLTHSFPSVAQDSQMDYIPGYGFHHRPSMAWPPPTDDEWAELARAGKLSQDHVEAVLSANHLTCHSPDGKQVDIKEQIQMYTTNALIRHPLVSPIFQPTLGGLPPLLIMVGGGELLRDEQIYLAHKCANPAKYAPLGTPSYKPTDVQLQVWDDLCHVAPTLSFTRPAKYMFRSIAQFGAWALARAQQAPVVLMNDDQISIISESSTSSDTDEDRNSEAKDKNKNKSKNLGPNSTQSTAADPKQIGKAGDPLPAFKDHMIRQRVTRYGDIFPLDPPDQLQGCCVTHPLVREPQSGLVVKWLEARREWHSRFRSPGRKVHKNRLREATVGYMAWGPGEYPPPSALAGRLRPDGKPPKKFASRKKSYALALWSLWGSKHDEATVAREKAAVGGAASGHPSGSGGSGGGGDSNDAAARASTAVDHKIVTAAEGRGSRPFSELQEQGLIVAERERSRSIERSRSMERPQAEEPRAGVVGQSSVVTKPNVQLDTDLAKEQEEKAIDRRDEGSSSRVVAGTAAATAAAATAIAITAATPTEAKGEVRPSVETARQGTGTSGISNDKTVDDNTTDNNTNTTTTTTTDIPDYGVTGKRAYLGGIAMPFSIKREAETASMLTLHSAAPSSAMRSTEMLTQGSIRSGRQQHQQQHDDDSDNDDAKTETGISIGAVTALDGRSEYGRSEFDGRSSRLSLESYVTANEVARMLTSDRL